MKTWGIFDIVRSRWLTHPGQLTEVQARRAARVLGLEYVPREQV